jgi:hypothetical protein
MEAKEDRDYKFLNYTQEKSMGRQAEEGMSWPHFFLESLIISARAKHQHGSQNRTLR